jgi:enhancing lycopene biosynthesis protein 2
MPPRQRRVAVVLSGSGVHDGSEIQEAVLCLLALDRVGASVVCAAPNAAQPQVVNHLTGEVNGYETRNALVESARIARGAALDLAALEVTALSAAVFPGGYGATKTLCDYAFRGRDARVHPDVLRFVRAMHAARKPLAFLCTAPVVAARALGDARPTLTIGADAAMAADLEAMGAAHHGAGVRDVVVDRDNKLVSSPAYMVGTRIADVADGIDRAIRALLELA